jgi:hypothetical protein
MTKAEFGVAAERLFDAARLLMTQQHRAKLNLLHFGRSGNAVRL